MHKTYNQLPTYVRSVNKRDQILETLLIKARAQQSDLLRHFIDMTLRHVTRYYPLLNKDFLDPHTVIHMKRLEWEIEQSAKELIHPLINVWITLRRRTYAFSWAATQKALLNAGMPSTPKMLPAGRLAHHTQKRTELGGITDRTHLSLERLKRKVMDAVQLSRTLGESLDQAIVRAGKAFPPAHKQKRLNVLTRALVEASRTGQEDDPLYGPMFIDADDWDDIVDQYKDQYVPEWRDPRYTLETPVSAGENGEYVLYPWQVEQEMAEDFVSSVRAGEVDSANEQGITDFVWIAILDSHTDECCRKREGLLTSEIQDKLDSGELSVEDSDGITPPLHWGCRCRLAPATDDIPERPADNSQELDDWLNS